MKSENFPTTKKGSNWTVVVFKCPRMNWVHILRDLFSRIEQHKECMIPHYTIRTFEGASDSLVISLRVLRRREDEKLVKSTMAELIKDYDYQIDPTEKDSFYDYHKWIERGATSRKWTSERCVILSKISKFALEIIDSDTTKEDREEWAHLFSNVMAMFDVLKVYWSPETMLIPERNPYKVLKY